MENPYLRSAFAFLTTESDHFESILVSELLPVFCKLFSYNIHNDSITSKLMGITFCTNKDIVSASAYICIHRGGGGLQRNILITARLKDKKKGEIKKPNIYILIEKPEIIIKLLQEQSSLSEFQNSCQRTCWKDTYLWVDLPNNQCHYRVLSQWWLQIIKYSIYFH